MPISIFRRKRRAKKSLASLLSDVSQSCQSWLEGNVFGRSVPITPFQSSSWEELENSYETNTPISFTYDPTGPISSPDKVPPQTQLEEEEPPCESCSAHEQFSQPVSGLLDVPPPSMCQLNSYSSSSKTSETVLMKVLLLILTLCLCIAISSGWLLGGVSAAVAFMVLLSSICMSKPGTAVRWRRAKTEDITSRNE
ncbi:transmembrane protein 71-like [Sinocyclocheilus grahami]|nr:PREDICTED: transmembrane protein 71-like [Sinocyclocheilus grahami]